MEGPMIITVTPEYMYDYYAYPHLFEGEEQGQQEGGFKHVTYVNNGAVISRPKSPHLRSSSVTASVSSEAAVETSLIVRRSCLRGFWVQPPAPSSASFASPRVAALTHGRRRNGRQL